MIGPILAEAHWVNAHQREQALEFAHDIQGDSFQVGGIYWYPERFKCCQRATYFAPDRPRPALAPALDASFDQAERERGHVVPKCPVCEPWEYLADRSEADRVRLVKALAKTEALHTMLVTLDEAQHEGRTAVSRMRNPADVLLIDQLERAKSVCMLIHGHHACVASTPVAREWTRLLTIHLNREIEVSERAPRLGRPEITVVVNGAAPELSALGFTVLDRFERRLRAMFIRPQRLTLPPTDPRAWVPVRPGKLRAVWVEQGYEEIAAASVDTLDAMLAYT